MVAQGANDLLLSLGDHGVRSTPGGFALFGEVELAHVPVARVSPSFHPAHALQPSDQVRDVLGETWSLRASSVELTPSSKWMYIRTA